MIILVKIKLYLYFRLGMRRFIKNELKIDG
jgi:hypothetical protein